VRERKDDKFKEKKMIIINALMRLLDKDVYSRITVQSIADEAGFSKGGILHYFHTKEDIYLELIDYIFTEFANAHMSVMEWRSSIDEVASMSALVSAENFIMDKRNVKIIINLLLYSFEEKKIQTIIKKYIKMHREFYEGIIQKNREVANSQIKPELSRMNLARVIQSIVFFIGVLEAVDPTMASESDSLEIVKFVTKNLKK
jgi:AcrR family transcriptional regulator